MGTAIEINDTLKISKERGFPVELTLEDHLRDPATTMSKVAGKQFPFSNAGERLYNRPPTRVFLVQEIDGKWLYWGHAMVVRQTLTEDKKTEGILEIVGIHDPFYQYLTTLHEPPAGKSYEYTPDQVAKVQRWFEQNARLVIPHWR